MRLHKQDKSQSRRYDGDEQEKDDNAFRYGFLGVSDMDLLFSYLVIGGFITVLFAVNLYLLKHGHGIRQ